LPAAAEALVEITRGDILESVHHGHWAVVRSSGEIVDCAGDPETVAFPRSSAKMIQALPLLESGAGRDLTAEHLALACASHAGERRHIERVARWLSDLGLDEHALCCGPQASRDPELHDEMIRTGEAVTRIFNNCSGKHTGFLTVAKHLHADLYYVDPENPVQRAVRDAFEDVTGAPSPGYGIDGCSAPNFATTVHGLAWAMARFAAARSDGDARERAAVMLREAIMTHPELVSGRNRPTALLNRAAAGKAAVKSGAEGVYVAILPEQELGVAVKVADGASRASEVTIAALLTRLGVVDPADPAVAGFLDRPVTNYMGQIVGAERPVIGLTG